MFEVSGKNFTGEKLPLLKVAKGGVAAISNKSNKSKVRKSAARPSADSSASSRGSSEQLELGGLPVGTVLQTSVAALAPS